jgi:hypothetical protein
LDTSFIEDPDEDDSQAVSQSKEDALLKAFIERKKQEFSMGGLLSGGGGGSKPTTSLHSNLKNSKLKSKDALTKKSNQMSSSKGGHEDSDDY